MVALIPCNHEVDYEWTDGTRYALVGKTSREIHMIFFASSYWQAIEVKDNYNSIMNDSGYEIMEVKQ